MDEQTPAHLEIVEASYGKESVRVLTWANLEDGLTPRDVSLAVNVEGDFLASFRAGDNAAILPSDTLRRHALAECNASPAATVDELIERIARRLLGANVAFTAVAVTACTRVWQRTDEHCFALASWQGVAQVRAVRFQPMELSGGVRGLRILLTTGSGFSGFLRDELTTQRESTDRPLCGSLDATWTYRREQPAAPTTENLVAELLSSIAGRSSNSIQQLLTDVGEVVLAANDELATLVLHFQSAPLSALPPDLAGVSGGNTYEVGSEAVGVTRVALRRT